jgi:ABC-type uncharacterized transport system substrate-binding protein
MQRRALVAGMAATLIAPHNARGQHSAKLPRIGHLMLQPAEQLSTFINAFEDGLRALGYFPGQNVLIEHRSAEGRPERLPEVAAELVRLKVDVILAGVNPGIAAAKQATTSIPIVMVYGSDPVAVGFIESLRRPGGNVTGGTADADPAILSKNLELLREAVPRMSNAAIFWNSSFTGAPRYVTALEAAAGKIHMRLIRAPVQSTKDFEKAFVSMVKEGASAVVVLAETLTYVNRRLIGDLAVRHRLAAAAPFSEFADAGGLLSYGPNLPDFWRRAAVYVDRILKGAKPADLPVEQPSKLELVINVKTAKLLGLRVAPVVLARADRIIE